MSESKQDYKLLQVCGILGAMVRHHPFQEEKYRPFVVTMLVGCGLWVCSGGFLHAYFICPDWEQLGPTALEKLSGIQPIFMLVVIGLLFGLTVEIAKFSGAVIRSQGAVLFAPVATGAAIGALQGSLVTTGLWGFAESVVYRSDNVRVFSGALIGVVLSVPAITIGIAIRKRGRPW